MRRHLILIGLLLLAASPAFADVIWPAAVLEGRILTWWSIAFGLIIEFFIVRHAFNLSNRRAAVATFAANLASTIAGIPLIPILGLGLDFFPGYLFVLAFHWGTFNPIGWFVAYLAASLINTAIEALVYKKGFKLTVGRRELWWIFAANALSVGAAFASIFLAPPRL